MISTVAKANYIVTTQKIMAFTYGNALNLVYGCIPKNNSHILLLSSLHKRCFLHIHISTYITSLQDVCTLLFSTILFCFVYRGVLMGVANANLSRFLLKGALPGCYNNHIYSVLEPKSNLQVV